jgi:hypothetical protein
MVLGLVAGWVYPAAASYKDDVGYTQLQNELGGALPTGAGVIVTQVEAGENHDPLNYQPNTSNSQFVGKSFYFPLGLGNVSSHATTVGTIFYGLTSSMSPGVPTIASYTAGNWLGSGFLATGFTVQPGYDNSRVGNHSYIGSATTSEVLRRLDWVIGRDDFIHVVGMNNGATNYPVLGSSFNAVAVGVSNGNHAIGSYALDATYTAGRTRPDLVAPMTVTSDATPLVASAANLLVGFGHDNGASLSRDPVQNSTTNRIGNTIYNSERSETVKAALLAGASRSAISAYTVNAANGMDQRYGAGQLNIYSSYHIIAAGEYNSLEDQPGHLGLIQRYGFDYDPNFGGTSGSNRTATYAFSTGNQTGSLRAGLVWNLAVDGGTPQIFDGTAILYDLNLYLYDWTDPSHPLVASSASTLDNTENLWLSTLLANRDYRLIVQAMGSDFQWDYGLAWEITSAAPLPGAGPLLALGLAALAGRGLWRRRS